MDVKIRKYRLKDRDQVLGIHWETGFTGKSMSKIYTNRKQWAKKAAYYLNEEPESVVVAEDAKTPSRSYELFRMKDHQSSRQVTSMSSVLK